MSKILGLFKKGARAASGKSSKKADGGFAWPSGVRIGIFGQANSGKTVYFTVLNEEGKIARDLQISVTDTATASEFLGNYRQLWGLGAATGVGTAVDLRSEKKFPDPTSGERILIFNAILDRDKKLPIVSYDYNGKAVSISESHDLQQKVIDFMSGCEGLLFFFDPKMLGSELTCQSHVASFVNMLERLAPLKARLPIPVALVITKADVLEGFAGEGHTVLIGAEDERFLSEDYELFLDQVLSSNKVTSNPAWSGTVRNVLVKLKDFLRIVVGRTLDFQIFFISCTGSTPERIGSDVGRSIYAPPARMHPVGVKEPFYWLLNRIGRSRGIGRFRVVAKYVALICFVWIFIYSMPHLYHFGWLLSQATSTETQIMSARNNNMYTLTQDERTMILRGYNRYLNAWVVKWIFSDFAGPAMQIRSSYQHINEQDAAARLNVVIREFTEIVRDPSLWPKLNPRDTTVELGERHKKLEGDLMSFHTGDNTTPLYRRSDRVLAYWNRFKTTVTDMTDTTLFNALVTLIQREQTEYLKELSREETDLGKAFAEKANKKVKTVAARAVSKDIGSLMEKINGNTKPEYRLDTAVTTLRDLLPQLEQSDPENATMVSRYLQAADRFTKPQKYNCKVEAIPNQGHVHIEVTKEGEDPKWSEATQILEGDKVPLLWKMGDDIHVAFDEPNHPCQLGKNPSDKKVLKGNYSLFQMSGKVSFENISKNVTISFSPPLEEQLPTLK